MPEINGHRPSSKSPNHFFCSWRECDRDGLTAHWPARAPSVNKLLRPDCHLATHAHTRAARERERRASSPLHHFFPTLASRSIFGHIIAAACVCALRSPIRTARGRAGESRATEMPRSPRRPTHASTLCNTPCCDTTFSVCACTQKIFTFAQANRVLFFF